MTEIPWSELRLVLMIQREGTLRAAAQALHLSHPTLSRRIAALQDALGVQLFEREGRRLRLTMAGEDLVETAARMEVEVDALSRRIAGKDHRLEGVVRVAVTGTMLTALAPMIPDFNASYPGIRLELVTGLGFASLTRREADVAIRFTHEPRETLIGRQVSLFEQAVYVSVSLQRRMQEAGKLDPRTWPWVDWDMSHRHHASAQWICKELDDDRVVARCDSSLSMYQLVRAGVGVGFAPTMLAGPDPELVRLGSPEMFPVFHRGIWVLTHPDLRSMGRVRATMKWLHECLRVEDGGVWPGFVR